MIFRQSFSGKITQNDMEEDDDRAADPEDVQFEEDGGGVRWQSTTIIGHVSQLLTEQDYGRHVSGEDVARGIGIRGQVSGNEVNTVKATTTLFYKRPIYKDFLYLIIAPEVIWSEEESWDEEFVMKVGIDLLLWGDDPWVDQR